MISSNPAPNSDIAFYPFHEGAALHLKDSHQLWVLNTTAATLFCLIDGTRDQHYLTHEYRQRFNLQSETARKDVHALLKSFTECGLLEGCSKQRTTKKKQRRTDYKQSTQQTGPTRHLEHTYFCISGRWFGVQCSHQQTVDQWRHLMAPLIGQPDQCHPIVELTVLPDPSSPDKSLHCWCNNQLTATGLMPENIMPLLVYQVFEHISKNTQNKLLIHAAVLAHNKKAIMFPGQTGAGKSTLSATLTQTGWTYLSDELAIIDPITHQIEPYTMPIGLKNNSVQPLTKIIPDLPSTPVHQRNDSKNVRYWLPNNITQKGKHTIKALIFPQYSTKTKTQLKKLSPLEALKNLTTTGSSQRPLTKPDIQTLLTLPQKPAYDLRYSNIEKATEIINKLTLTKKLKL